MFKYKTLSREDMIFLEKAKKANLVSIGKTRLVKKINAATTTSDQVRLVGDTQEKKYESGT